MKYILSIVFIFLLYLLRIIIWSIEFLGKIISNLLEKKCKEKIEDIVAITYYSEHWPDLVAFTLYYDEKLLPNNFNILKSDAKISKKDFDIICKCIDDNKIINKKKYILNFPYVSFSEYLSWFFDYDARATTQSLTLYFKNGESKYIIGYSKELKNIRKALESILPREMFY